MGLGIVSYRYCSLQQYFNIVCLCRMFSVLISGLKTKCSTFYLTGSGFVLFCSLDCFRRCGLMNEKAVPNVSDHHSTSLDNEAFSSCTAAQLEDDSGRSSLHSIVAYGLGHFAACPIARFQFALLLQLTDMLKVSVTYVQIVQTEIVQDLLTQ